MALLNAEKFGHPSAVPVIHVASGAPAAVLPTASRGATARLIIKNEYLLATACNIVITIRGQHRSSPGMVMMTPRSSWWQSTAEPGWPICLLARIVVRLNRSPAGMRRGVHRQ
jgi:hypothetical protein